uniref:uncharacterized protein isoform X1 n=1 Tax=Myxine glutinosa TaxID=7769 RepID=UPI00358F1411
MAFKPTTSSPSPLCSSGQAPLPPRPIYSDYGPPSLGYMLGRLRVVHLWGIGALWPRSANKISGPQGRFQQRGLAPTHGVHKWCSATGMWSIMWCIDADSWFWEFRAHNGGLTHAPLGAQWRTGHVGDKRGKTNERGPGPTGSQPQSKYAELLAVIEELGRDVRPTYAGSKSATERLKRGIIHARALVRECLAETERSARS